MSKERKKQSFHGVGHPDNERKPWKATTKAKAKTELPLFPLPDESTETETLEMPERELTAIPE